MSEWVVPGIMVVGFIGNIILTVFLVGRRTGRLEGTVKATAEKVDTHDEKIKDLDVRFQKSEIETANVRGVWITQIQNLQNNLTRLGERVDQYGEELKAVGVLVEKIEVMNKTLIRIEGRLDSHMSGGDK